MFLLTFSAILSPFLSFVLSGGVQSFSVDQSVGISPKIAFFPVAVLVCAVFFRILSTKYFLLSSHSLTGNRIKIKNHPFAITSLKNQKGVPKPQIPPKIQLLLPKFSFDKNRFGRDLGCDYVFLSLLADIQVPLLKPLKIDWGQACGADWSHTCSTKY